LHHSVIFTVSEIGFWDVDFGGIDIPTLGEEGVLVMVGAGASGAGAEEGVRGVLELGETSFGVDGEGWLSGEGGDGEE
jgi:hypothetical protein